MLARESWAKSLPETGLFHAKKVVGHSTFAQSGGLIIQSLDNLDHHFCPYYLFYYT